MMKLAVIHPSMELRPSVLCLLPVPSANCGAQSALKESPAKVKLAEPPRGHSTREGAAREMTLEGWAYRQASSLLH
ncbi:MAG: hypothetical protein K2W95_00670 [Candidatus Obscuribacterales bacterium]|nr:hypothetical protein [Candidatus Obscuribacterales bacterium]